MSHQNFKACNLELSVVYNVALNSLPTFTFIFIAHQHAMHAQHDIVLPILSVHLSSAGNILIGASS